MGLMMDMAPVPVAAVLRQDLEDPEVAWARFLTALTQAWTIWAEEEECHRLDAMRLEGCLPVLVLIDSLEGQVLNGQSSMIGLLQFSLSTLDMLHQKVGTGSRSRVHQAQAS